MDGFGDRSLVRAWLSSMEPNLHKSPLCTWHKPEADVYKLIVPFSFFKRDGNHTVFQKIGKQMKTQEPFAWPQLLKRRLRPRSGGSMWVRAKADCHPYGPY